MAQAAQKAEDLLQNNSLLEPEGISADSIVSVEVLDLLNQLRLPQGHTADSLLLGHLALGSTVALCGDTGHSIQPHEQCVPVVKARAIGFVLPLR